MTAPAKAAPTWLAWLPVVTTLALIAGFLLSTGGKINELADHERRLAALETRRDFDADKLDKINERTARIEAKLEVLLPTSTAAKAVAR
ncbi:MAG TPA: hypothetical protein VN137_05525 [Sphingomonas sp.]|nr:hypothetical protein [Sphingomonas sp.]